MDFEYSLVGFTLVLATSLFVIIKMLRHKKSKSVGIKLPPSPYAWPFVGNLFNMDSKKPHIALSNISKSLGSIFSLKFGSKIMIVVSSPEAVREVYKYHDKELSGRFLLQLCDAVPQVKTSVIVMATKCDKHWRDLRAMSHTLLFSSEAVDFHSHMRMQKVREMIQHLGSKQGEVIKIADIIFATVLNSLSMAMTSKDIIKNWDNIEKSMMHSKKLLWLSIPRLGDLYPHLAGLDFRANQRINEYYNICTSLWGDILAQRRHQRQDGGKEKNPNDFLDTMINNSWDDLRIYSHLIELFASVETMTTTSEWAIAELTRNPEVLNRLRDELDEAIGKGNVIPTRDITMLPFLQACVKETFRLHPPLPFLVPRVAVKNCEIMNYDVPKGSLIITNAYALGRDPKTWDDPNSFKPDHFLGKSQSLDVKGTNYELLPFGGGRRICAGYPLALNQIQLILAFIVYSFDWSIPGEIDQTNIDMEETFNVVLLQKEKPLQMILKKRKDFNII